jgi:hypothetical protein
LRDGAIQLGEREEGAVPKAGQDPALDQQDTLLDFGFITGATHPRRDDRDLVVACHLLVGRIQVGLVAMRFADTTAQIIRDDDLADAADELKGPHMRADPVG